MVLQEQGITSEPVLFPARICLPTNMTEAKFTEFLQDVLITVHANIRDLEEKQGFADPEEQDYIAGRLFSYQEVLAIFRASAKDVGVSLRELGL